MVWKNLWCSLHSWNGIRRYSGSAIGHSTNLLPPDTEFVVHGFRSAFLDVQLETLPIVRYSRSNQIKSLEGTRDHFDPWLRNESETLKQIETDFWRQVLPLTVGIDQLVRRRLSIPKLAYSGHLWSDCLLFPRVQAVPFSSIQVLDGFGGQNLLLRTLDFESIERVVGCARICWVPAIAASGTDIASGPRVHDG